MALALIYMVMAAQFERIVDPLIVMLSVPLIVIGVVPTMLLTGTTFNIQSLMGVVMLIGIVVNNAIVQVDYINLLLREHKMPVEQAVLEAGRLRQGEKLSKEEKMRETEGPPSSASEAQAADGLLPKN